MFMMLPMKDNKKAPYVIVIGDHVDPQQCFLVVD